MAIGCGSRGLGLPSPLEGNLRRPPPNTSGFGASYHTKIVFSLGPQAASVAASALKLAVLGEVDASTDCIRRLGWGDGLQLVDKVLEVHSVFSGDFYARGAVERMSQTTFPRTVDNFQLALSSIVMLQNAVIANRHDAESLRVLTRTARSVETFCEACGQQIGLREAFGIPIRAYLQAVAG